jgi:pimeloyl-ACP methyl ester carboxylesterase
MTNLEHTTIQTNGVKLHVVQAGPQDGPLVILLHGFPEFWYGWRHQIDFLVEQGYRLWMPDQRGYNLSDKPAGIEPYNQPTLADDVRGLIDASGRKKVFLVGHDWGAAVAWWTAMKYPERLEKLVILNVPHPIVSASTIGKNWEQTRKSWYIFAFQIPRLPEALISANNWKGMVRSLNNAMKPGTFTDEDLEKYREAWSQPGAFTAMVNWYRAAGRLRPKLPPQRRIIMPTRIIWGAQDIALIREGAQMSMEFVDHGDLIYIEEAGHFVQHEAPDRVNELIAEFLQK